MMMMINRTYLDLQNTEPIRRFFPSGAWDFVTPFLGVRLSFALRASERVLDEGPLFAGPRDELDGRVRGAMSW